MSLTKNDLQKIKAVVQSERELIIIRLQKLEEKLVSMGINNNNEHKEILTAVEEIKQMETEDLEAFAGDLGKLEKRVIRLETKTV